jgi:hypothetical protein
MMRKMLACAAIAACSIAAAAGAANATQITPSPGGSITATISRLGFTGPFISLFTCKVVLEGSIDRGPITLPGAAGRISRATINECSARHTISPRGLPWTLTAQTALARCPSSSTGVLGVINAGFTIDGLFTTSGNIGTLVSSGRGSISVLSSRLSNGGQVLAGSGTYEPVNTISCT